MPIGESMPYWLITSTSNSWPILKISTLGGTWNNFRVSLNCAKCKEFLICTKRIILLDLFVYLLFTLYSCYSHNTNTLRFG